MITPDLREYDYYLYDENNSYGQRVLIKDEQGNPKKQGTVKLAIYTTSQAVQDNINYHNAQFLALTHDKGINDTYAIQYGESVLKVLYVGYRGRYKQVFLNEQ